MKPLLLRRPCCDGISRKQHVEAATFGGLRHFDEALEIYASVQIGIGMPPGGNVVTDRSDEEAELHLPYFLGHR
jgi:hypothetical protein